MGVRIGGGREGDKKGAGRRVGERAGERELVQSYIVKVPGS